MQLLEVSHRQLNIELFLIHRISFRLRHVFHKLLFNEQLLVAHCKDVNEKQYKIIDILHKTTVGTSTTIATPAGLFRSAGKVQATTSIPGRTSWTDFNRP